MQFVQVSTPWTTFCVERVSTLTARRDLALSVGFTSLAGLPSPPVTGALGQLFISAGAGKETG